MNELARYQTDGATPIPPRAGQLIGLRIRRGDALYPLLPLASDDENASASTCTSQIGEEAGPLDANLRRWQTTLGGDDAGQWVDINTVPFPICRFRVFPRPDQPRA